MCKNELRKQKMIERNSLSLGELQALSDIITDKVISLEEYDGIDKVLCYVSCRSEVRTIQLIEKMLWIGKIVGVPKVEGDAMNFYRINTLDDLAPGYFGILEPNYSGISGSSELDRAREKALINPEGSLVIVPGLAFDRKLNRIGYGKGFYDRYFQANKGKNFIKCGIAFDIQLCNEIESDEYDMPLDILVTESETIYR